MFQKGSFLDIISTIWWIMKHKIKARLEWIKLYEETKDAGLVCRRCGISRKWWRRFQKSGQGGLEDLSRCPKSSPNRKIFEKEINLVSELRKRRLGSRLFKASWWEITASVSRVPRFVKFFGNWMFRHLRKAESWENTDIGMSDRFPVTAFRWTPAKSRPVCTNTRQCTFPNQNLAWKFFNVYNKIKSDKSPDLQNYFTNCYLAFPNN